MKLILLCSTLFSKDDAIYNRLSKMLEKNVKENQVALSESKKNKKSNDQSCKREQFSSYQQLIASTQTHILVRIRQ